MGDQADELSDDGSTDPLARTQASDPRMRRSAAVLREDDISTIRPGAAGSPAISGMEMTLPGGVGDTRPGALSVDDLSEGASAPPAFQPGDHVGTFVVDRELGKGAMGVVLLAHDPELDRPVAIKLLRRDYGGATAMARMTREAQSIAKISHPNVVAVHQVGTHKEQLFIVMEFVDGGTLREWIQGEQRSWQDTLSVYLQAGRGLEAAHAAGLVHRDFKPDNVLIGADGRVRVTDFGLVGAAGERSSESGTTLQSGDLSDPQMRLTQTGFVMGTPAYMSPEQHMARPLDERSDQFSFCVALFEALYDERPFRGGTLAELAVNVTKGRLIEPPDRDIPSHVRDALLRGLQRQTDDRFDTMGELLLALDPPRRGLRWPVLAGAGVLVAGLSAGAFALGSKRGARATAPAMICDDATEAFGGAWDSTRHTEIREAFDATGHALATDTAAKLDEELASYRDRWTRAWDAACSDAADGRQTQAVYELRRACLQQLREEADTFSAVLASDAERLIDGALSSATLLRPPDACADVDTLQGRPVPTAEQLETLAPLRREITRARILLLSGRHHEVLELTRKLEPQLREVGFGADLASNLVVMARGEMQTGEYDSADTHLREAISLAAEARAHSVEARAIGTMMFIVGTSLGRLEEAYGMLPSGRAAAVRSGDPRAESYVEAAAGVILQSMGKPEDAIKAFDRVIELLEAIERPPPDELGMAYSNRAGLHMASGRTEESFRDYEKGLQIIGDGLGRKHPFYGALAMSLGMTLLGQDRDDEALEKYQDALQAWETVYGKDHTSCASILVHISQVHQKREDWDTAWEVLEDAHGRHVRFGVDDYAGRYSVLDNLGTVAFRRGDFESALKWFAEERALVVEKEGETAHKLVGNGQWVALVKRAQGDSKGALQAISQARSISVERNGPKHGEVAGLSVELGELHRELGDCKTANQHFKSALKVRSDLESPPDAQLGQLLVGIGSCELASGDVISAQDSIGRAASLIEELELEGELAAQIELADAKLKWAQGDRETARSTAEAAGKRLDGKGPSYAVARAQIESWLDANR